MSTSICQGQQSCLEPALAEPQVLRLKLALPKSNLAPSSPEPKPNNSEPKQTDANDNKTVGARGGWNFLEALSNAKNDTKTDDKVYVHPMAKRSSAMLTAKSLEMCTEGLGSETGSDSGDSSGDEMSLLSSSSSSSSPLSSAKGKKSVERQAAKRSCNRSPTFPPPLTSVSGSSGLLQVRPHREDGRLVLRAVIVPSTRSFFHAERIDGRLTLRLMSSEPVEEEAEEEEDEEAEGEEEDIDEVETETEIEEEENIDEDNLSDESFWSGDVDGNTENNNAEDEVVNGKLRRPIRRCNEDGRGERVVLLNWESFLVAS